MVNTNKGNKMTVTTVAIGPVNGPIEFDEFVMELNDKLESAVMEFNMSEYNSIVSEMAEFGIKPEFILDAPNSIELPNHGFAHVPAKEFEPTMEELENDAIDSIMNRIDSEFPIEDEESDEIEFDEEFDCIAD
jgi:hypothetical protein